MKTANSVTELIGHTPLLELHNFKREIGYKGRIFVKLESFNPGGSVKDRIALSMIEDAGLKPGAVIIEPTSGNTGIGLAMIAAARGMRLILTMPESMSMERRQLLAALGAELVLTPASQGMRGAVDRAEELRAEIEGSIILSQFTNPANPMAHERTTALEIIEDMEGQIDVFVAGIGTGGTVSGTGRVLKQKIKDIRIIGVEPSDSPLISKGIAGPHKIQGIGANFVPENLDQTVVDQIITATTEESIATCRTLARTEGVLAGISSGAALSAGVKVATEGKNVIVILPDTGERYLSTGLF